MTIKSKEEVYLRNPWYFNNEPVLEADKKWAGFVYLIIDTETHKRYIGKKFLFSKRKNAKTGKRETKESDWKTYYGSNPILKDLVKATSKERFRRVVLSFHTLIRDVNYTEMKQQYVQGVLEEIGPDGEMLFMNGNIAGKHWAHLVKGINQRSLFCQRQPIDFVDCA